MEFRDGWWSPGDGADDPGVEPAWLQPACVCGWRGERVVYDPQAEDAARGQWDVHMDDVTVYFLTVAKAAESLVATLETARKEGEYDARPLAVVKALCRLRTGPARRTALDQQGQAGMRRRTPDRHPGRSGALPVC